VIRQIALFIIKLVFIVEIALRIMRLKSHFEMSGKQSLKAGAVSATLKQQCF
jgi:hypothetical protein